MTSGTYVLAIDQGTTSSRAIIFDHAGKSIAIGQLEHEQIFPRPGWVEHNPAEIIENVNAVVGQALGRASINRHQLVAVGITNQRESTVVWDKTTGKAIHNVIVWQDTRTQKFCDELATRISPDELRRRSGMALTPYMAGPRISWILDNVEGARERAAKGDLLFGTMDTWVLWNLTGGLNGGVHATDVTNASRTGLMDLRTLQWDPQLCELMNVPMSVLPEIRPSSYRYGNGAGNSLLIDTPITGMMGDQQAATFGQACFKPGMVKNTYGTGCFLLMNTGSDVVFSEHGLLTTVCYQLEGQEPVYALEGSIAVAGSLVQWLRDNLKLVSSAPETEELAAQVKDNGGAYIVPAFSGLFAPYWRGDARGIFTGLTRFINRNHIARAALEATAYQTRDVVDAMNGDSGVPLTELRVDGGMTVNNVLMQFQADQLGVKVVLPEVAETTALGAAYAAGLSTGYWDSLNDIVNNWAIAKAWEPSMDPAERDRLYRNWGKAIRRSMEWVDEDVVE